MLQVDDLPGEGGGREGSVGMAEKGGERWYMLHALIFASLWYRNIYDQIQIVNKF